MKISTKINETMLFAFLLSFVGGFQDAYSYVGRQHVFANAQTGNLILLGINALSGNIGGILHYLLPLSFFSIGILIACILRANSEGTKKLFHWHQKILIIEMLLLMVNVFIPFGKYDILANSIISLSCAIQVEAFQHFTNINAATTMCIGNIKGSMENLFKFIYDKDRESFKKFISYIGIILFFAIGAVAGVIFTHFLMEKAILVCIFILFILLILFQICKITN
ncbi:MAG: YoaK family protein [Eubacteriales bacterium]|nr:YoaK family protein [Eubacteriales bacterium]